MVAEDKYCNLTVSRHFNMELPPIGTTDEVVVGTVHFQGEVGWVARIIDIDN